jgi:hypothetical protein
MFFARHIRAQAIEENPNASFGEIGRVVGKMWKEQTAQQKKV